jgi:hypothetical protein
LVPGLRGVTEDRHNQRVPVAFPAWRFSGQWRRYAQLLDTVDFSVPTPAVVREGYLAP